MALNYGTYGFIRHEKMEEQPLILLDMGLEHRQLEIYDFDNRNRAPYTGYIFQLTLRGCGIYESGGTAHVMHPWQGFFAKCPSDSRYYLSDSSPDAQWDYFYLHFEGSACESFYQTVKELYDERVTLSPDSPCVQLFMQLYEKCRRQNHLDLYEGSEFLYRFFCQMLRTMETPVLHASPLVKQAMSYLREHFNELESIHDVSSFCGVSHEHMTRCFHKETGQSPLQFLTKLRMEHALLLLLNTNQTIDSIGKNCGFQNGNYFSKVFHKYLHCSPDAYRRMNL